MVTPLTPSKAKQLKAGDVVYRIGEYKADGTPVKCVVAKAPILNVRNGNIGTFRVNLKRGHTVGVIHDYNVYNFTLDEPRSIPPSTVKRR
jgi:hypothetical protein